MNPRRRERPCPVCAGREYVAQTVVRGTPIWRCMGCGLATWDWAAFDAARFYDHTYWRSPEVGKGYADYFSLAAAMTRTHRQRIAWLTRLAGGTDPTSRALGAAPRPRLLDAGCGPGFFVQAAAEAGYSAAGIEVSEYAVRFAREQLLQDVWQGQVRAADLGGGPFDVVTMWDVIEHLPEPEAAVAAVADVLRDGGLLAVSTGDIASLVARLSGPHWHLFNLPEHLWFFTPGSLERLLRRAGFAVVARRYEVCWYTVRYLSERVEAMFRRPRLISGRLGRVGEWAVPFTLGDVMTVAARKRGVPYRKAPPCAQ